MSLTNSLALSADSFISDFISLGKTFMNIKNNKGPRTYTRETLEGIFYVSE